MLEVLVALAILTVVTLPLLGLINYALVRNSPQIQLTASMIARDCLERTLMEKTYFNEVNALSTPAGTFRVEKKVQADGNITRIYIIVAKAGETRKMTFARYVCDNQ